MGPPFVRGARSASRRRSHRRSSEVPIRRESEIALTREPSWSIQTVGTSTTRQPASRAEASRSTSNSRSRAARRGSTSRTTWRRRTLAPHCVSRYGSPISIRTLPAKPALVISRESGRRAGSSEAGWRREAIAPSAVPRGVGQPQQLARRRRAVGVDEADELGVRARERLGDHAALAELGVLERPHALVLALMARGRSPACGRVQESSATRIRTPSSGQAARYARSVRSIRSSSLCAGITMSRRKIPPVGGSRVALIPRPPRAMRACDRGHSRSPRHGGIVRWRTFSERNPAAPPAPAGDASDDSREAKRARDLAGTGSKAARPPADRP